MPESDLPTFCETKAWVKEIMAELGERCSSRTVFAVADVCMQVWRGELEPTIAYRDPTGCEVMRRMMARLSARRLGVA